ncbi:MAG: magnesium/cobalt transporter CorA [Flavobacteriales bacterium]|nr:magnesium/cobalt transporter CorA [Flavobacteriales bacterium]
MSKKIRKKVSEKAGLPPGSLVYIGAEKQQKHLIELISYTDSEYFFYSSENADEVLKKINPAHQSWFNVVGLTQIETISKIGSYFSLHHLLLEDILNTDQRAKSDVYEQQISITLKVLNKLENENIEYEQISLVLGKNYIISFQEKEGDMFSNIRNRLNTTGSNVRNKNTEYLFYRLLDHVVDSYFSILEKLGERIELLENEMNKPSRISVNKIHELRRELIIIRKNIYPLREALNKLIKDDAGLLSSETERYLGDVYDHCLIIIETLETYRELASGLTEFYMSTVSNKMNEVIKTLTIISTIFIPLTFLVGVYGMNFKYMPEIDKPYAYPIVWGIMLLIAVAMLVYFKVKKWL